MKNQKERQTYSGALDYQTKEFIVQEYQSGNTENTIEFIKYLQQQRPGKRLAIFWDGATPAEFSRIASWGGATLSTIFDDN